MIYPHRPAAEISKSKNFLQGIWDISLYIFLAFFLSVLIQHPRVRDISYLCNSCSGVANTAVPSVGV